MGDGQNYGRLSRRTALPRAARTLGRRVGHGRAEGQPRPGRIVFADGPRGDRTRYLITDDDGHRRAQARGGLEGRSLRGDQGNVDRCPAPDRETRHANLDAHSADAPRGKTLGSCRAWLPRAPEPAPDDRQADRVSLGVDHTGYGIPDTGYRKA